MDLTMNQIYFSSFLLNLLETLLIENSNHFFLEIAETNKDLQNVIIFPLMIKFTFMGLSPS